MKIDKIEKSFIVLLLQENLLKWRRKGVSDPIMCLYVCCLVKICFLLFNSLVIKLRHQNLIHLSGPISKTSRFKYVCTTFQTSGLQCRFSTSQASSNIKHNASSQSYVWAWPHEGLILTPPTWLGSGWLRLRLSRCVSSQSPAPALSTWSRSPASRDNAVSLSEDGH